MFYVTSITPQIADTDMQGHINFLAYASWFDRARTRVYRSISPEFNFRPHGMVVLKTETTYLKEVVVQSDVEIRTWTSKLGEKSFELTQEVWQNGERCAVGKIVYCGFNFDVHKSEPLQPIFRAALELYRWTEPTA